MLYAVHKTFSSNDLQPKTVPEPNCANLFQVRSDLGDLLLQPPVERRKIVVHLHALFDPVLVCMVIRANFRRLLHQVIVQLRLFLDVVSVGYVSVEARGGRLELSDHGGHLAAERVDVLHVLRNGVLLTHVRSAEY